MTKATRIAMLLAAVVGGLVVVVLMSDRGSGGETLNGLLADFMKCLPNDLTEVQVEEVESILLRYQANVRQSNVRAQDGIELTESFKRHVATKHISRNDLNQLMVRVSFYMNRENPFYNPADGSAVHPLLEESDSTR